MKLGLASIGLAVVGAAYLLYQPATDRASEQSQRADRVAASLQAAAGRPRELTDATSEAHQQENVRVVLPSPYVPQDKVADSESRPDADKVAKSDDVTGSIEKEPRARTFEPKRPPGAAKSKKAIAAAEPPMRAPSKADDAAGEPSKQGAADLPKQPAAEPQQHAVAVQDPTKSALVSAFVKAPPQLAAERSPPFAEQRSRPAEQQAQPIEPSARLAGPAEQQKASEAISRQSRNAREPLRATSRKAAKAAVPPSGRPHIASTQERQFAVVKRDASRDPQVGDLVDARHLRREPRVGDLVDPALLRNAPLVTVLSDE